MVLDIVAYVTIIEKITQVFNGFIAQKHDQKEKNAARILKAANVLIHSLTELDNEFKRSLRLVMFFEPDFTRETRDGIKKQIESFALDRIIMPHLQASVGELENESSTNSIDPERCKQWVSELVRHGRSVIEFAEGKSVGLGSYFDDKELYQLLALIGSAETEDDALRLKDIAHLKLRNYDETLSLTKKAERDFGNLKGCIGARYPAATVIAEI